MIDGNECERREEEENNVYIFWNGDECYIDTNNTQKIKYINHNCDPNCYVDEGENNSLILFSLRDIKAGEELTIDYGYEEIYEMCNCNSCRTRGVRLIEHLVNIACTSYLFHLFKNIILSVYQKSAWPEYRSFNRTGKYSRKQSCFIWS